MDLIDMARKPSMTAADAEALLGPRGALYVSSANRGTVQKWLVAKGVPATVAKSAKLATLAKAYNDASDRYLSAIIRNRADAAPDNAPQEPAPLPDIITQAVRQEVAAKRNCDPSEIPTPAEPAPITIDQPKEEAPTMNDTATPAPSGHDHKDAAARHLQQALALIAGGMLDERRVIDLIREHAPKPDTHIVRHEITIKEKDAARELPDEPRHHVFADVLALLAAGENVLLVGPAGCGKTHLGQQLADALELPFLFTGAVPNEYKLTGFKDAHGNYQSTAFRRAFEEGGLFLWDELDGSSANAMLAFNAALANGHMDFPDGNVRRHDRALFIASANTYGHGADRQYVGRNQMDAASLDRFAVVPMDYDTTLELRLFGDTEWTRYVQRARYAARELKIRHVISMRAIKGGLAALEAGMPRDKVEQFILWKHLSADEIAKIKAAM